jgi:hypothetical protein
MVMQLIVKYLAGIKACNPAYLCDATASCGETVARLLSRD